ncbi:ABC transporter permease [Inquilinus sp. Marseille-Q2685]|uniref:ABC transporter permease n=1 Tax=Inquilinus sp. Marseille-Q2685 TaxID=2866581 RepID=UPI001CE407B4|nr:ABC transporter permease [Inquilinus sp. Marseille-Q2685]
MAEARLVERFGTPAALAAIVLGFALARPDAFATAANLLNVTQQMAILAIVAAAATLVMVIGEFDLSVGFVASLAGVLAVKLLAAGLGPGPAILLTLLACGLVGGLNGLVVHGLRAPSFIATLALGTIASGLAYWLSGGASLFQGIPPGFTALARTAAGPVPVLTLWMLAVLLAAGGTLALTVFGRRLIAIGSNREAARLSGVPIGRPVVAVFAIAAALSGLAGVLLAARLGSVQHTMGESLLLPAYAAVFLGMTAFRGGRPNLLGTAVGVAIIAVLANGLTILNVDPFFQKMVTGAIIIGAVMLRRFGMAAAR